MTKLILVENSNPCPGCGYYLKPTYQELHYARTEKKEGRKPHYTPGVQYWECDRCYSIYTEEQESQ